MKKYYIYGIATILGFASISLEATNKKDKMFSVEIESLIEKVKAGDNQALVKIAEHYTNGYVVEKNDKLAAEYYAKAADLGNKDAAYNAAVIYQSLSGTVQEADELAFKYFKLSARTTPNAMFNLGACFINGIGTEQDLIKAYYCFNNIKEQVPQAIDVLKQLEDALGEEGVEAAKNYIKKVDKN